MNKNDNLKNGTSLNYGKYRITLEGSISGGEFELSRCENGEYKGDISETISGINMKCTLTSSKGEVNYITLTR